MLLIVVLAAGIVAAIVAYAVSASSAVELDPIDPANEHRALRRFIARRPRLRRFIHHRLDRASAGGFMLTVGATAMFVVALIFGVLLRLIDKDNWLGRADSSLSRWGSEHSSSRAVDVLKVITEIGATRVVVVYLVLVALYDYRKRKNAQVFLFVAVVEIGQLLLNNGLKLLVGRERPDVMQLVGAHSFSFPSGHTCAAAAATSAVALILGRDRSRRTRALLAGAAALGAMGVATSRALLGVHWLSDVLGGLALGWGWFIVVAIVFGGRRQHIGEPTADLTADNDRRNEEEHGRDRHGIGRPTGTSSQGASR